MARPSSRNYQRLFGLVGVDPTEKGPEVSEDVQLVYIADDIRQRSGVEVGARASEAAVVGEFGFLSLRINAPGGVEITQITAFGSVAPANLIQIFTHTSQTLPTITGAGGVLTPLRTGILPPVSTLQTGTVAAVIGAAFVHQNDAEFAPFYVAGPFQASDGTTTTQFFNITFGTANLATVIGLRWRELRLFP